MTRSACPYRSRRRAVVVALVGALAGSTAEPACAQVPDDPAFASQPVVAPQSIDAVRQDDEVPAPKAPAPRPVSAAPPLDLSDHSIRKAIADSKQLMDGVSSMQRSRFGDGGAPLQQRIDQDFKDAEIPSCLTMEAFKFNPPVIGPFTFSGFAALPIWAHAIASGGCRF